MSSNPLYTTTPSTRSLYQATDYRTQELQNHLLPAANKLIRKDRESSKQGAGASHYQLELIGAAGRPRSPRVVVVAGGVVRRSATSEEQHKEGGGEG